MWKELDQYLERPLRSVVFVAGSDSALLNQETYRRAALFALDVALFHLVQQWQVQPDLIAASGLVVLTAAYIAGVLSLSDAAAMVTALGPGGDAFRNVAERVTFHPPMLPIVSDVTGTVVTSEELTTPDHWVSLVAGGTRRFRDMVATLESGGARAFLEFGPGEMLSPMIQEYLDSDAQQPVAVPLLRADCPETDAAFAALGHLYVQGVTPNWTAVVGAPGPHRVDLPTYPFQRRRYWLASVSQH